MNLHNPLADDDQDGYMPTVDVIQLVRANFAPEYIRSTVERVSGDRKALDHLDQAVAVEIACRELLSSQRWIINELYDRN